MAGGFHLPTSGAIGIQSVKSKSSPTPAELRERLSGPIPSLKTPFNEDGSIDFNGLRQLIDFNIAAGARTLMV